ncbi:hypothetical protein Tco_0370516 [Tanacetum coccineum]
MVTLRFVDTHNMIAFLSKPTKSEGFKQIVDFLNAHPIRYALTVNLTIYVSCIEQFWSTAKAKTVNEEVQLHAKVDGKKIIITKSFVRRDLRLADEEDEAVTKEMDESLVRATTTASSLEAEQDSGDTSDQARLETVSKQYYDSLLARGNIHQSDEDKLKLNELMVICTNLQQKVLDLEDNMKKTKTTHSLEIVSLNRKIRKIKKQNKSRTYKLKRLYKVGLTARVESSGNDANLNEDASNQGRKFNDDLDMFNDDLNADEEITLVHDDINIDDDAVDVHDESNDVVGDEENVVEEVVKVVEVINTAKVLVDTAKVSVVGHTTTVSTAAPTTITATTLITVAPKQKGITIQEPSESTTTTTVVSNQQPKNKDKGKAILNKELKALKRKHQLLQDEEVAARLQAEFDEEERLALERAEKEQEANIALINT